MSNDKVRSQKSRLGKKKKKSKINYNIDLKETIGQEMDGEKMVGQ